ncbi:TRAP transporter substrate-binding protein [Rhodovibrionaceae bacterium A322]
MSFAKFAKLGLGLAVGAFMLSGTAQAAEVTLKIHHFLPPKAPAQTKLLEPWAQRVEEQSNGRIEVEIYPSMTLGGKPPQLYKQVRDGVVDLVWTVAGYTSGAFPHTEVFELPFVHVNDAVATNLAIQDLMAEELASDFKDIKPILVHVHTGQALHMVDTPVRSPEDMAGKKIRIPSRTGGWMLEELGANPVGMPVPQLPQALSKKVVDGAMIPFEVTLPLKVHELTKYSTEGPNGERFGTAVFIFGMNQDSYDALPDDLKAVIDANSGMNIAREMGETWNKVEEPGKAAMLARGNEIIQLTPAELDAFKTRLEKVNQRWVKEVTANGIDGQALLDKARAAVAKHSSN